MKIILLNAVEFAMLLSHFRKDQVPMIPYLQTPHIWFMGVNLLVLNAGEVRIGKYVQREAVYDVSIAEIQAQSLREDWEQLNPARAENPSGN